jgi:ATP phosphoribosyltransferase
MITLHCPPQQVHGLAELLRARGAEAVSVSDLSYVFTRENPLFAALEHALGHPR